MPQMVHVLLPLVLPLVLPLPDIASPGRCGCDLQRVRRVYPNICAPPPPPPLALLPPFACNGRTYDTYNTENGHRAHGDCHA